jgi:Xaa-Pro aminopeptidase
MLAIPVTRLEARLGRLRIAIQAQGLDALVVTHPPNITYLTNFVASAGILVVGCAGVHLITDFRYVSEIERGFERLSLPALDLVRVERTYEQTVADVIQRADWRRVGLEAEHVSWRRVQWLAETLPDRCTLVPTTAMIETERACKDEAEIATLRAAGALIMQVGRDVLGWVQPGLTERALAADIDRCLRRSGFDRPAFETIVASGPNAGLPHARPSDRTIQAGDLVVLDFGGVYGGYCVDLSRTVSIGVPSPEARRVFTVVQEAQNTAIEAVRVSVAGRDVDAAARDVLTRAGLGEAFGHSAGHGLGLEVHEAPRLSRHSEDVLAAGMVFTIEPGAYLSWGKADRSC